MDTWTLEFRLKPEYASSRSEELAAQCEKLLKEVFCDIDVDFKGSKSGILRVILTGKSGLCVLVQAKDDCLLAVDIHWPKAQDVDFCQKVQRFASIARKADFYQSPKTRQYPYMPPVKRGRPISAYAGFYTKLCEYDYDRIVYDEMSKYQHVLVLHSPQYGNCLVLDNVLNIAESDLEYTKAITGFDQEDYTNKTVLVLGGGDGGILHYLKDLGPKMITLIDIDQKVIDVSRVHLRGVCHDALDSLSSSNHEVIVDDCVKYLRRYAEENRKFDYVISDLTDVPISTDTADNDWELLRTIIRLSMSVLEDDGKLFTHGAAAPDSAELFEEQVEGLEYPLKLEKRIGRVPSFLEDWYFYTLCKKL